MPHEQDPHRASVPVVGIGASAGGVEALQGLVRALPSSLPAAIVVVLHIAPEGTSVLAQLLDRAGLLPATPARDGQALEPGHIYVAPPDRHVLVEHGRLRLDAGPRINGHRPAVDPMLSSLADAYGRAAVGVILSGTRDDGTRGLYDVKAAGGTTLVQDPAEARHGGMIRSALRAVAIDAILPVEGLAQRLAELATHAEPVPTPNRQPSPPDVETATRYTCPDCGGVLWRHEQGSSLRYACSVGHAYSPDSLAVAQGRNAEDALWTAVRILGDRRTLLTEMAAHADAHDRPLGAEQFRRSADELASTAATIRGLIEQGMPQGDEPAGDEEA